jgi:hypothetical protein
MKKILSLTIAIMAFAAVTAVVAQAQTATPKTTRAHIPFAFHVANKELPAGEYRIAVVNPSSDQTVLQIRSLDGRASAMIRTLTTAAHAPEKSRLAFHRYGESYFFAQLQVVGESTTLTAVKSNAERVEAQAASKPVVAFVNTF